jgi:FkbM family methyltransferase
MRRLAPRLDGFDPATARRIRTTVSCPDADEIEKVDGAGETLDHDGTRVQIMHNGLMVEEGGYFGAWMAEIIRCLRGHHEPQEELVFDRIVKLLRVDGHHPVMIEFGSYWTYYGLWFCRALPSSKVVALEPDPAFLEVGRRNAALNGCSERVTFFPAAIGAEPGQPMAFRAASDGELHQVEQHDLASLMKAAQLDRVDLVLCDAQGAEAVLLDRACGDLQAGRVRFLIVSTHHHSISGDPLTHQQALGLLTEAGAHVISEHTVGESFSGDGLIAVSFDDRDRDLVVPVSHGRSRDSLFGEAEFDLAEAAARRTEAEQAAAHAQRHAARLEAELTRVTSECSALRRESARLSAERNALEAEVRAITGTKVWRWARGPRRVYARIKRS